MENDYMAYMMGMLSFILPAQEEVEQPKQGLARVQYSYSVNYS